MLELSKRGREYTIDVAPEFCTNKYLSGKFTGSQGVFIAEGVIVVELGPQLMTSSQTPVFTQLAPLFIVT